MRSVLIDFNVYAYDPADQAKHNKALPDLALKSLTVALGHGLSFWDGLIWAAAHHHQVPTIYIEDFQHDRVVEGVRFVTPFVV